MNFESWVVNQTTNHSLIVDKRYSTADNSDKLPEYQVLSGNIGLSFMLYRLKFVTRIQGLNILNKSISIIDGYPTPGREFRFSLEVIY